MNPRRVFNRIVLAVAALGIVLALVLLVRLGPKTAGGGSAASLVVANTLVPATLPSSPTPTPFGKPVRLRIPSIRVDASFDYVGLTPSGDMAVTQSPTHVMWYELGPRPGEIGSAVIAGHYGTWKDGSGSVFDQLHTLQKGDTLSVQDDQGATVHFMVRETRRYDPNADASDVFTSPDGRAHLNLVTCEGTWNGTAQSYSKRLVVFTDKV